MTVEAPQEVAVEFVDVWGDVTVDLGERLPFTVPKFKNDKYKQFLPALSSPPKFRCKAIPEDFSSGPSLRRRPGEMTWRLGGEVLQTSGQYQKVKEQLRDKQNQTK